jgi:uncharacterized protein YjiS (DUF1127 family)
MMTTGSTAAQPSASGAPIGFVGSMVIRARRLAASWRRRTTSNALHELDDRTLRDIGLARDQIETAIAELERLRRTHQSFSHWF